MTKIEHTRLVVVLGMHRSGTSAIARGLEVLGVKLGDNLHPAAIDNPKGFWEDRNFLSINEELLAHIGSAYDRLGLINWNMQNVAAIRSISLKAEKLVREKCDKNTLWGFKDPRTARLLPFWQSVFKNVGCNVGYVIATRNPISIVESLRKRDGFEPEKTFFLWLEHLIPAILKTKGAKRVVVDYDQLLENSGPELLRVARALGLPAPEPLVLAAYENEFLEGGLRHTLFTNHDLDLYPAVPSQVIICYDWLVKLANDNVALESSEAEQAFDSLSRDLLALSPALNFMARQEKQITAISQAVAEREQSLVALQAQVQDLLTGNAWLSSQREAWEKIAAEREQSIAALQAHVQDLLTGNAWLTSQREAWEKTAAEREQSIAALQAHVQDLLTGNAWLTSQREAWEKTAAEREQFIAELTSQLHKTAES